MPRPHDAGNSAQFVAVMRQLRQWAHLSYRELERRAGAAGDVLPRATLAGVLSRQELPREELLAAFVRACGGDEPTVEAWVGVRKRLAVELEQYAFDVVSAEDAAPVGSPDAQRLDPGPEQRSGLDEGSRKGAASHSEAAEADVAGVADEAENPAVPAVPAVPAEGQKVAVPPPAFEPSPVAVPATGANAGSLSTSLAQGNPSAAPRTARPAPAGPQGALRRLRRPSLVIAASAVIVLLTAAVTGILLPRDDSGGPQVPRTGAPAATVSPSRESGRPSGGATSSAAVTKPVKDGPASSGTVDAPSVTPSKKPTVPRKPEPGRTPQQPGPTVYEPPPTYEPPPSFTTPPVSGGGDSFPEETCWDVTNDCV
ncbi:helix-turn-helix domain-containing protein [Streptomyces sp. NPDC054841]